MIPGRVAHEGAAALVADHGQRQVGPTTARQLERLEQQHAALGLEQVLGDEEKRRFAVGLRPVVRLDGAHARADRGDAVGRQAVARDQVVADVAAEREDVGKPVQRFALGLLERRQRPFAVSPGMDMVGLRQRPAVVAVEIVLDAARAVGRRQIEGAGMEDVSRAEAARGVGDLRGEPASRPQPAQDLLAAERTAESRQHVAGRDAPFGEAAHARADGFDGDAQPLERVGEVGRRTGPRTQVARIAEDAGDGHAIEAQRVTDVDFGGNVHRGHEASPVVGAASDQPVTCPIARVRRHRLITQHAGARSPILAHRETRPHATNQSTQETMPTFPSAPVTGRSTRALRQLASDGAELLFFCPDVTDASTLKRVQQFMDFGYRVTVFGFRRERYNTAYRPPWPNVPLGFTSDARYWHRVRALLCAIPVVFAHRAALSRAAVFYARNIDQLLLALLARLITFSRAPVAYEVLDIPPILMRRGPVPALLRAIERLCLRRTACWFCPRRVSIATTTKPSRNIAATGSCSRTSCIPRSHRLPRRRRSGARPRAAVPGWSAISA